MVDSLESGYTTKSMSRVSEALFIMSTPAGGSGVPLWVFTVSRHLSMSNWGARIVRECHHLGKLPPMFPCCHKGREGLGWRNVGVFKRNKAYVQIRVHARVKGRQWLTIRKEKEKKTLEGGKGNSSGRIITLLGPSNLWWTHNKSKHNICLPYKRVKYYQDYYLLTYEQSSSVGGLTFRDIANTMRYMIRQCTAALKALTEDSNVQWTCNILKYNE